MGAITPPTMHVGAPGVTELPVSHQPTAHHLGVLYQGFTLVIRPDKIEPGARVVLFLDERLHLAAARPTHQDPSLLLNEVRPRLGLDGRGKPGPLRRVGIRRSLQQLGEPPQSFRSLFRAGSAGSNG